jgi:polyisoprenoid-binding protein YceI
MKLLTKSILPILLLAALAVVAQATHFSPWKGSTVVISGTSTLHDWTMEGSQIDGSLELANEVFTAATVENWQKATSPAAVVTIPVTSIKSEHTKMDKLMQETLKASKFPTIKYELLKAALVKPGTSSFVVGTHGRLTIAGVSREIDMNVNATRGTDNRLTLSSEVPIKISDYGLKPPTAMMGTIKTGDLVKVTFHWVVETH